MLYMLRRVAYDVLRSTACPQPVLASCRDVPIVSIVVLTLGTPDLGHLSCTKTSLDLPNTSGS